MKSAMMETVKTRKKTKRIAIGKKYIGDGSDVLIQSMLNQPSDEIKKNVEQAKILKNAGCEILRVAVPDKNALNLIPAIKSEVDIPLVADIHFDFRLAIESVFAGADKIRINPGNIGSDEKVKQVTDVCRQKNIPIRIGVNSGSIDRKILEKHHRSSPEAMVESALSHVRLLEKFDFDNIVISLKSSSVTDTVLAYRLMSDLVEYPLHLGVTESGTVRSGTVKSSIGLGSLLLDGIGDTIRVSLTADPIEEIFLAKQILKHSGYLSKGIEIISCPTCGRTRIGVIEIASLLEKELLSLGLFDTEKNIKVAVMGCVVNGPGEAKDADVGIAGGNGCAVLFKKGQIIKKISEQEILTELISEIKRILEKN